MPDTQDYIDLQQVNSLADLFRERVERSPKAEACRQYDVATQQWMPISWHKMQCEVLRWQVAIKRLSLEAGDRVGVMLHNCPEWVVFDQAALGLGLVVVPLYIEDRPDNVAHIVNNANIKLLLVAGQRQWQALLNSGHALPDLQHIVSVEAVSDEENPNDLRLRSLDQCLFEQEGDWPENTLVYPVGKDDLASIVYTSGTTGKPKGVMLSHRNILSNAWAGLQCMQVRADDVFLSFLPLSHMLERTVGYYLAMMAGATVVFTRGIAQLAMDMEQVKPTVLISVPRIYERVYSRIQTDLQEKGAIARYLFTQTVNIGWQRFQYQQGRCGWFPGLLLWPLLKYLVVKPILQRLGGRMRIAISGGAPLPPEMAKIFIGLGLPLLQGYGLTETSPVIAVNRRNANIPESIGQALPGVQVRIAEKDELQVKADSVMLGYWDNKVATAAAFTEDGWLRTGDCARIDAGQYLYITGRIKDIIVLANGEKVPPADMEMAIALDTLFEQVMVVGEGRSHLTAIVVLQQNEWCVFASKLNVDPADKLSLQVPEVLTALRDRMTKQLKAFPGYAQIRAVLPLLDTLTVESGLLTPTLKLKRSKILECYADEIDWMYQQLQKR